MELQEICDQQEERINALEAENAALHREVDELRGNLDAQEAWSANQAVTVKRQKRAADELVRTIAALVEAAAK